MNLPIRITPDLLKDAIVEIRYSSDIPINALPGTMYKPLKSRGYSFVGAPELPPPIGATVISITQPTFLNENITCRIGGVSLIFNCKENYIGWTKYRSEIQGFLKILIDQKFINAFNRIGVRYINMLKNTNIFLKLKEGLSIKEINGFKTKSTNLKTEIVDEVYRIIINVGNDFIIDNEKVSLFDIDVIYNLTTDNVGTLIEHLDKCHLKEKELFFGFLREDFISTLMPEYEKVKES